MAKKRKHKFFGQGGVQGGGRGQQQPVTVFIPPIAHMLRFGRQMKTGQNMRK